jgi:hypothetical protein
MDGFQKIQVPQEPQQNFVPVEFLGRWRKQMEIQVSEAKDQRARTTRARFFPQICAMKRARQRCDKKTTVPIEAILTVEIFPTAPFR